jgi:hypothetical protein
MGEKNQTKATLILPKACAVRSGRLEDLRLFDEDAWAISVIHRAKPAEPSEKVKQLCNYETPKSNDYP